MELSESSEDNEDIPCNIASLSNEALIHILQYLPLKENLALAMLCKRLSSAVEMHFQMVRVLDLNQDKVFGYMSSSITDDHIHCLLKKCPRLEVLYGLHPVKVERRRLRKRSSLTVPGIIEALSLCPCLKAVETCDLKLLEAILQHLPQLEIIGHFRNRDGVFPPHASQRLKLQPYPRLTSLHLIGVDVPELTAMPQLRHLHLHCVRFTKLQPFRAFLAQNLRTFVMKHCMGPAMSIRYLSLIIALTSCPALNRLELVRVPLPGGLFQRAVEDSYKNSGFINLKTLVIAGCKGVMEADIGYLMIVASKNLETISIQPSLTKDSLFVSLSFARCTFRKLETLHLGYVDKFQSLGEWSNDALLTFGLAELPDTPSSLTDSGMKVVGHLFPNLKSLTVSNCPHLISMNLWSISELPAWEGLQELILQRCHCLQLSSFAACLSQMPSIQTLILEDMFRDPPKGCSHVGLSAGTGLGMSSAVVSNQDEHIAVQGHQHDLEPQGDDPLMLDNDENDRDMIEIDFDDIPPFRDNEPHFMVLRQDFFDEQEEEEYFDHREAEDMNENSDEDGIELIEMNRNQASNNENFQNKDIRPENANINLDLHSPSVPSSSSIEEPGNKHILDPSVPSTSSLNSVNTNSLENEKSSESERDVCEEIPLSSSKAKLKRKGKNLPHACRKSQRLNNKSKRDIPIPISIPKNKIKIDQKSNNVKTNAKCSNNFDPNMPSTSKDGYYVDSSSDNDDNSKLNKTTSLKKSNANDKHLLKCKMCGGYIKCNNVYAGPLTRSRKKKLNDNEHFSTVSNKSSKANKTHKIIQDKQLNVQFSKDGQNKFCDCINSIPLVKQENNIPNQILLDNKQASDDSMENLKKNYDVSLKDKVVDNESKVDTNLQNCPNSNQEDSSKRKTIKAESLFRNLKFNNDEKKKKEIHKKMAVENKVEVISQGTQATSADIRRSLRAHKWKMAGRLKQGPQMPNPNDSSKKGISGKHKFWKEKPSKNKEMFDKATSTSDPLLEEDAVQILRITSDTLVSLTVISCGLSDIIIEHCIKLAHIEVQACRILKNVQLGICPCLARYNVTQCPKLLLANLASETLKVELRRWMMIYYEPCFQDYTSLKGEHDVFSKAPINHHVVLFNDYSKESPEDIIAQRREFVFRWLEMVWFMYEEVVRKGNPPRQLSINENSSIRNKYPWGHRIEKKHGHFVVPEVNKSVQLPEITYQLISNSYPFMRTFEHSDFKKGFPSVDDTYYSDDLSDLKSYLSSEVVENGFFYETKVIGFYIKTE